MTLWQAILLALAVTAGCGMLYGLHRLCLWLEARGHLYYLHKKPGGTSPFVAMQEMVEPTVEHVHRVKEEKRTRSDEEGAGPPADTGP